MTNARHDEFDDLVARLRDAAEHVPVPVGEAEVARLRGDRRRRRQRGALAGAGAGAVLAAVVALGLPGGAPTEAPRPVIDQPGPREADPTPTSGSSDEGEATELAERFGRDASWPAETAPIESTEWIWPHIRYGQGIRLHDASGARPVQDDSVRDVVRAVVVPGLGVAHQLDRASDPSGSIWFARLGTAAAERISTEGENPRLLTWGALDNDLWWTARLPGSEGSEQFLFRHDLDDGTTERVGRSGWVESGIDGLAFAQDGTAVWLSCHLQCTAWLGTLEQLFAGDGSAREVASGWYSAVDVTPDGLAVLLVEHADPTLDPDGVSAATLVPVEAPGSTRHYPLPRALVWGTSRVQWTPDVWKILIGDADGAWVIDPDMDGGEVRPLAGPGGAAVDPLGQPREQQADWAGRPEQYAYVAWPLVGRHAFEWTVREGRPDGDGWQTSPVEVASFFVDEAELVDGRAEWTVRGVGGTDGTVQTTSWVNLEVEGVPTHRIEVTSFEASPYQWVTGLERLTPDGELADGGAKLYASFSRRDDALFLSGPRPAGGTFSVKVLGGMLATAPELELTGAGDDLGWSWQADAAEGEPVSLLVSWRDEDGHVAWASLFTFPTEDGAAG